MTIEPRFLILSEVIEIHDQEIATAGGLSGVPDLKALESSIGAPQASFNGQFLMDIFEMAARTLESPNSIAKLRTLSIHCESTNGVTWHISCCLNCHIINGDALQLKAKILKSKRGGSHEEPILDP